MHCKHMERSTLAKGTSNGMRFSKYSISYFSFSIKHLCWRRSYLWNPIVFISSIKAEFSPKSTINFILRLLRYTSSFFILFTAAAFSLTSFNSFALSVNLSNYWPRVFKAILAPLIVRSRISSKM